MTASQLAKCQTFKMLHEMPGIFVMPNPWDVGTAIYLQSRGFKALASTSAGAAFAHGRPDRGMSVDEVLEHLRQLVDATGVPVNADFEDGFSSDIETMARYVVRCVDTGVAGLSIEDRSGDTLYSFDVALERVRAARSAIDASNMPVVFTARSEAMLLGAPGAFEDAKQRLVAFAEAGAECLYAPGVREPEQIAELVAAVAPKPLNVLANTPSHSVAQLGALGVRRVSVGGAMALASWRAVITATDALVQDGSFGWLADTAPGKSLNALFTKAVESVSAAE